uniref:Uncharacterized protein n=1 Tax=Rhizophora mucronata TaxID=61149 RepID=A0A2P2J7N1_RHIMU
MHRFGPCNLLNLQDTHLTKVSTNKSITRSSAHSTETISSRKSSSQCTRFPHCRVWQRVTSKQTYLCFTQRLFFCDSKL